MPPLLHRGASNVNFVVQVSHPASFLGIKKTVSLQSCSV